MEEKDVNQEKHVHRWVGYLHCSVCANYYLDGKCRDCDKIRLLRCPLDGSILEFIDSKEKAEKKE